MNMPEIDPRLEGKCVRDITDKFIRENATEEELNTIRKQVIDDSVEAFVTLKGETPEEALEFANDLMDILTSKREAVIEWLDCEGATVVYKEVKEKTVNPLDHFRVLWQSQIRERDIFQKEYEEWLRLNEKFGEEN